MLINDPNHLYKPNLNLPHISSIKGLYFKVYKYYMRIWKPFLTILINIVCGFYIERLGMVFHLSNITIQPPHNINPLLYVIATA